MRTVEVEKESAREADRAAVELFVALVRVMRPLKRSRPPLSDELRARFKAATPARRHTVALVTIAAGDGLSVSDLAERLDVSLASASQLVCELSDFGLVHRHEDPDDRRRTLVEIDPEHRELAQAFLSGTMAPLQRALATLPAGRRKELFGGLRALGDALESEGRA